jgi:hypothetical protein
MKKLLVVLLSLGLIVAFAATASAQPAVKFGGSYYVVGVYENNAQVADLDRTNSRAFFYQRIRIEPVFQIAEGLTFTTRFDAMEKQWGQTDWRGSTDDRSNSRRQTSTFGTVVSASNNGTPKTQENIEFERGYVTFKTAAGVFDVGYQSSGKWGTDFGDDENSRPRVKFTTQVGPMVFLGVYEKEFEADNSSQAGYAGKVNADQTTYALAGIYNFKGGAAGVLYKYFDRAATRPTANFRGKFHALLPYFKATFGPVYMEGEFIYQWGKARAYEDPSTTADVDLDAMGAYLKARMNIGPAYFGGAFLYSSGDDGSDATKAKTGPTSPDLDFGLILGFDSLVTWKNSNVIYPTSGTGAGNVNGAAPFDGGKANSWMYSAFGGFNPTPKLNLEAMLIYASRDKVPAAYVSKNMGLEFDVTAKYKIYDNLTYMVGAGYLWTGDYFKGTNSANAVGNDYLLMNRLSLSF